MPKTPTAAPGPSARYDARMDFVTANGRLMMFGGRDNATAFAETWRWDGSAWTLLPAQGPVGRTVGGFAYDISESRFVLFGGTPDAFSSGDTWHLEIPAPCPADIVPTTECGDGMVDVDDLLAVINAWGACP